MSLSTSATDREKARELLLSVSGGFTLSYKKAAKSSVRRQKAGGYEKKRYLKVELLISIKSFS